VAPEWGRYPAVLAEIAGRLRGVMIENAPALDVVARYDGQGVLFYCDPPYVLDTRAARQTGNIYQYEMTDDEHVELAEALHRVAGAVVLSGYDSEMYRELYGDWRRVERDAVADGGVKRTEVLWLSPNVATQAGLFD
jgi:DNA adenine methylase